MTEPQKTPQSETPKQQPAVPQSNPQQNQGDKTAPSPQQK
jgi:hypothetical protein